MSKSVSPHVVFISYAHEDKEIAYGVCKFLEDAKIECWIAPRNVEIGVPFAESIAKAIDASTIWLVILSPHSNESEYVKSETQYAVDGKKQIVSFKTADFDLNSFYKFLIGRIHWLSAFPSPHESYFPELVESLKEILKREPPPPSQPQPVSKATSPHKPVLEELEKIKPILNDPTQTDAVEQKLQEILTKFPNEPDIYLYLGDFYKKNADYGKAKEILAKGIEINEKDALLYWSLALTHQQTGNLKNALEALEQAFSLGLEEKLEKYAIALKTSLERQLSID